MSSTPSSAASASTPKGDVTGYDTFVWYLWKDGKYAPVEPGKLTE